LRKSGSSRRPAALLAAIALHALLAVFVASRMSPPVAEAPVMTVTLVELKPRSKPPSPTPPPAAPRTATSRSAAPAGRAAKTPSMSAPGQDWRIRPSEGAEAEGARTALRGKVGCRTADLLALTKTERAACDEALAKGAETAPTYAVISPKLKKVFDGTFECPKDDVWCEYRMGKAPYPGLFAPHKKKRDPTWD